MPDPPPPAPFASESAMVPPLRRAIEDLFLHGEELWVILDEHQLYSRIPDLVAARLNVEALEERVKGAWTRALNETELRGLRAMRPDRGARLSLLARHMQVSEPTAQKVLRGLVHDGYAERTLTGTYARRAPVTPILGRILSFEAKRSDALGALVQAREHAAYVDGAYVAFDNAYRARFDRRREQFASHGIGLLALDARDDSFQLLERAGRGSLHHVLGRALSAERTLARLAGGLPIRRLPESRLPGASGESGRRGQPQLVGRSSKTVQRLLVDLAQPASGPARL